MDVENLWKTCGKPVENSRGKVRYSKVFHNLSTGFPQLYPQVFHRTVSLRKVIAAITIRMGYNGVIAKQRRRDDAL
jgi:hypothetical protein